MVQSDHFVVESGRWSNSERKNGGHGWISLRWLCYQERVLKGGFLVVFFAGVPVVEGDDVMVIFHRGRGCVTITQLGNGSVERYEELNLVRPYQRRITGGEIFIISTHENEM